MIPGRPLVGCVGTAMATIMKYHNYPQRGTGSYNGVNFDVAYDWDNMRMDNYRYGLLRNRGQRRGYARIPCCGKVSALSSVTPVQVHMR